MQIAGNNKATCFINRILHLPVLHLKLTTIDGKRYAINKTPLKIFKKAF